MKRLFFFMIIAGWMHVSFSADTSAESDKKSSILLTASQALDAWWNEDTGLVSESFLKTDTEKQEARENIFSCDMSSYKRRDVRRGILVIGLVSAAGASAFPQLAIPILSYGAISTFALGFPLIAYKAPEDTKKKLE